ETTGAVTTNWRGHMKLGSAGQVVDGMELKLSEAGEVLVRGPMVFRGYLNQPDKTRETLAPDGWLHTGDVGRLEEDGFLYLTDRMKDIIITAGGKNITPSEIENQLKFSPYISDAVVIGDRRPYLTCLVMIDQENVEKFAQDNNIPFTNYASLCRSPEVQRSEEHTSELQSRENLVCRLLLEKKKKKKKKKNTKKKKKHENQNKPRRVR